MTFSSTSSNDNISPSAEIRGSPRNPIFTPSESSLRESIISVLGGALGSLKQLKTRHTKSFVRSTPGMCQRELLFLKLEPCVSSSTEVHAVVSQSSRGVESMSLSSFNTISGNSESEPAVSRYFNSLRGSDVPMVLLVFKDACSDTSSSAAVRTRPIVLSIDSRLAKSAAQALIVVVLGTPIPCKLALFSGSSTENQAKNAEVRISSRLFFRASVFAGHPFREKRMQNCPTLEVRVETRRRCCTWNGC